jgi:BrnA antitoxin of type II toxin-antitoxin system
MKPASSSRKLTSKQVRAAISAAPTSVADAEATYDPNDPKAVAKFWKGALITRGGGVASVQAAMAERRKPGQRGPGIKPSKVAINIRLSLEVLDAFKATGEGWQTKVDGALKDWLKDNSPIS